MTDTPHQLDPERLRTAGLVTPSASPFALPAGLKGRMAGWVMGVLDPQHRELAEFLTLVPESRVIDIGTGPGQMVAALLQREPTLSILAVDPSPVMLSQARRRNKDAIRKGSVTVQAGAAGALPAGDGWADLALSVNNLPMWPDLGAGAREVCRVLRPGGIALLAWHGGTDPRGHQRRLVLPQAALDDYRAVLAEELAEVEHHVLRRSVVFRSRSR